MLKLLFLALFGAVVFSRHLPDDYIYQDDEHYEDYEVNLPGYHQTPPSTPAPTTTTTPAPTKKKVTKPRKPAYPDEHYEDYEVNLPGYPPTKPSTAPSTTSTPTPKKKKVTKPHKPVYPVESKPGYKEAPESYEKLTEVYPPTPTTKYVSSSTSPRYPVSTQGYQSTAAKQTYPDKKTDKDNHLGYPSSTSKYPSSTLVYPDKKKKRTIRPTTARYPLETPKTDYAKDQDKAKDYQPTSTSNKKPKNKKPKYQGNKKAKGKEHDKVEDCDEEQVLK